MELFADGFEGLGFWRRLKEEGCIVTENADHYHYYEDWQEDPIAECRIQEQ
jgi:hypothetical protein